MRGHITGTMVEWVQGAQKQDNTNEVEQPSCWTSTKTGQFLPTALHQCATVMPKDRTQCQA